MGDGEMMGVCRPCVCMALAALERSFWAGEEGLWWCSALVWSRLDLVGRVDGASLCVQRDVSV